jgi:hypothetical protein
MIALLLIIPYTSKCLVNAMRTIQREPQNVLFLPYIDKIEKALDE